MGGFGQVLRGLPGTLLGGGNTNQLATNALIAAITAIAGGQGVPYNEKTSGTTNTTTNSNQTSTSTPNLNPATLALLATAVPRLQNLSNPQNMSGLQALNIQQINQATDAQKQALEEEFAARGLANSPAAAAASANLEQQRINQITQMNEQLPFLQRQLELQALQQSAQLATSIPYGSTVNTQGTSNQQQTNNSETSGSNGGGLGGALGGLAAALALMSQQGKQNNNKNNLRPFQQQQTSEFDPNKIPNISGSNSQNNPITITIYDSNGQPQTVKVGGNNPTSGAIAPTPTPSPIPNTLDPGTNVGSQIIGYGNQPLPNPSGTTVLDPGMTDPGIFNIDPNTPIGNPTGSFGFGNSGTGGGNVDPNADASNTDALLRTSRTASSSLMAAQPNIFQQLMALRPQAA